jgi:hypothetical protein
MSTALKTIVIHENRMDSAICEVIAETSKAIQVRNTYCGRACWFPKAALKAYKPGVETYEDEYTIAKWLKLTRQQEKVVNLLE